MPAKSAVGSVTIISAVVVLLAQLAQLVGYTISETDQQALVNLINSGMLIITTIVSMVGAVGAIWGRIRATKQITSVVPQPPPARFSAILAPFAILALLASLSACQLPKADVDKGKIADIEKRIVTACANSGLFKIAGGLIATAVPATNLPIGVINAGVDQVCADPARFANDAGTVEWVIKNLAGHTRGV